VRFHIVDTDGVTVRILDGLAEGDRVARNLGDAVIEGQRGPARGR